MYRFEDKTVLELNKMLSSLRIMGRSKLKTRAAKIAALVSAQQVCVDETVPRNVECGLIPIKQVLIVSDISRSFELQTTSRQIYDWIRSPTFWAEKGTYDFSVPTTMNEYRVLYTKAPKMDRFVLQREGEARYDNHRVVAQRRIRRTTRYEVDVVRCTFWGVAKGERRTVIAVMGEALVLEPEGGRRYERGIATESGAFVYSYQRRLQFDRLLEEASDIFSRGADAVGMVYIDNGESLEWGGWGIPQTREVDRLTVLFINGNLHSLTPSQIVVFDQTDRGWRERAPVAYRMLGNQKRFTFQKLYVPVGDPL